MSIGTGDVKGRVYDRQEPYNNLVTWVYDGTSYAPVAKLTEEDSYTVVQECRTIWARPYRPSTARARWFGTAYLTSMGMYWNSEVRETPYLSVSKDNTKTKKQGCTTTGSGITRHMPGTTLVRTR